MILINGSSVLFQLLKTALTLTHYFCNFVIEGLVWKRMHSISIVFELPSSPMYMLATGLYVILVAPCKLRIQYLENLENVL